MSRLSAEQHCLLNEARNVWNDLEEAKVEKLSWGEETITEILLKNLKLRYPGSVEIIPFNKPMEGESGADWIWSFVNEDDSKSLTMLVQAKRLDKYEREYKSIMQKIGRREPPVQQTDQLLETANREGVMAFYAFYNYLSDASLVPITCASLSRSHPDQFRGFGISMAHAEDVIAKLPDVSFASHAAHSRPLHCLLCTKATGTVGRGGTPEAIHKALRDRLSERLRQRVKVLGEGKGKRVLGFQAGMHPTVARALEAREALSEGLPGVRSDFPNVMGIVVFRDEGEAERDSGTGD